MYKAGIAKVIAICVLVMISLQLQAQKFSSREYNIKAIFLYNFTQFVEWPPNALGNVESPFVIGILGDDPFRTFIDQTVAGEKVKGHAIEIQRFNDVKDIKNCHILYISAKEATRLNEVLSAIPNKNVLTVSDIPNFARTGGIIHFINLNNKIGLQINASAAKAAELNISSKLLRVAEIVDKSKLL